MAEFAEDEDAEHEDDPDGEPASAREARYRVRAREAEQRAETQQRVITDLQAQIEGMHRAEAERLASDRLASGEDLSAGGVTLDDLLDADGRLDPKRVDEAVAGLLEARPHWAHPLTKPAGRYSTPVSGASSTPSEPRTDSWKAAFAPPQRD